MPRVKQTKQLRPTPSPARSPTPVASIAPRSETTPGNQWLQRLLNAAQLQPKLRISQPDDVYEREADRIADHVLRMPTINSARTRKPCAACAAGKAPCSRCVAKNQQQVQRRADASAMHAGANVAEGVARPHGSGRPLDPATRAFMEPRFGRDFGGVRIHTDTAAAVSARAVRAQAYTIGSHLVFGAGRYAPESDTGRWLIAHELAHVVQNHPGLHRCADPQDQQQYDQRATAIHSHPAYRALRRSARRIADDIIATARTRDDCLYYMDKLELLLNTPDAPPSTTAAAFRQDIQDAATAEAARLATAAGQQSVGEEEAQSGRATTRRRGEGNVIYYVDNSDPNNIVVRVRVRLQRRGGGTAQDVANVASLEDAIEEHASTRGYVVDLEFVNTGGRDVFTVGVDPTDWPTSGNWVSDPVGLAHELHHLLGLDDRYNYIEDHAANADMNMPDRLHWFREELTRTHTPGDQYSLMGYGTRPLDDDVCRAAGLDLATCTVARRAPIDSLRFGAHAQAFRVYETLAGLRPASPFDRPGEPSHNELERRRAQMTAFDVFGRDVPFETLQDRVGAMRSLLTPGLVIMTASAIDPQCQSASAYVVHRPRQIWLCPSLLGEGAAVQRREMLRQAARLAGAQTDTACTAADCSTACGDPESADTWARFVTCAR